MSVKEEGTIANNQDIPEVEDAGQGDDSAPESEETGQDIAAGGQEEIPGKGSETERGLPKDYAGLRKIYTQGQQRLAELTKKTEFYQSLLRDPEISPIIKKRIAQTGGFEPQEQPAQATQPQAEAEPVYEKMTPNEIIGYISKKIEKNVWDNFQQLYGTQVQPVLNSVTAKEANNVINSFFSQYPNAKEYATQIGAKMAETGLDIVSAWKIIDYDNAPIKAKEKLDGEIQLKRDANVLKSSGGTPSIKTKGKMTAKESIASTLAELGIK